MYIEFCLPVYNEEAILKENVLTLLDYCVKHNFSFDWKIVIVNNGSTDSTEAISQDLHRQHKNKIECFNVDFPGKGNAINTYCKNSKADVIVYMDIDLAVGLDSLDDLLNPVIKEKSDIVIGSRLLPNSQTDRSLIRELSSRGYSFLSRIILRHKLRDLQCGFKAVQCDKFKQVSPFIYNKQWFFDTELIVWFLIFGFKIKEIPVNWSENRYQQRKSKINIFRDSFKFFISLIKLRFRLFNYKHEKKDKKQLFQKNID